MKRRKVTDGAGGETSLRTASHPRYAFAQLTTLIPEASQRVLPRLYFLDCPQDIAQP